MASTKIQPTLAYAMQGNTVTNAVLTIDHASWGWGATDLAEAKAAYVIANVNGVTISWDGTDPTITLGLVVSANEAAQVSGNPNIQNLKMIRTGGVDATVTVILEK